MRRTPAWACNMSAKQYQKFSLFMVHAFARITLELGVFGLLLVLILMWSVLVGRIESRAARRRHLRSRCRGHGRARRLVVVVSIVYKDLIGQMSMSFLFWYFAGLVAAQRMRIAAASR